MKTIIKNVILKCRIGIQINQEKKYCPTLDDDVYILCTENSYSNSYSMAEVHHRVITQMVAVITNFPLHF